MIQWGLAKSVKRTTLVTAMLGNSTKETIR
jgi:hypothetical protein